MAAHRAHEEEDLLRRDGDLEPLEGAVDLLEGEHARARVVELEEGVVQQQASLADRLARARGGVQLILQRLLRIVADRAGANVAERFLIWLGIATELIKIHWKSRMSQYRLILLLQLDPRALLLILTVIAYVIFDKVLFPFE